MINNNIKYKTKQISKFYSNNRSSWKSIYDSERKIIDELNRMCGTENDSIIQFEFPIIFEGLEMIGNYDDLIHYLQAEIQ